MSADLAPPPAIDFTARARELQARQPATFAPPDDSDERRERLHHGRVTAPDLIAHILAHPDAPGAVTGHPGSEAACGAVADFAASRATRTLSLLGRTGTGKTWSACWVLARHDGVLLPFAETPIPSGSGLYERALRAGLLVLNDLAEPTGWQVNQLASLLCDRHDSGRRTILTSNLFLRPSADIPPKLAISHWYGDRVADRLADRRLSRIVACGGPSLRGRP